MPTFTWFSRLSKRFAAGGWMWSPRRIGGAGGADDAELLAEALADRRVMLTNDSDFLGLAARYSAMGETFAPIYFWPQQRRSIGEVARLLLAVVDDIVGGDGIGAVRT